MQVAYTGQTGQKMDYMFLLQSLMMTNPAGAVALAKMAVKQVCVCVCVCGCVVVCVCVCVCVCERERERECVCVCVCANAYKMGHVLCYMR
jgi:clathrin heavy chain